MRPVLAYHLILSTYGFWLPNDPRGSWSEFVRAFELQRFGPATKVTARRSHAHDRHDASLRREAKRHMARSPVRFTGLQARAVARGFATFTRRSGIVVRACAVMPDHCHLVVMRHRYSIEEVARHLKADATTRLTREGIHPFADDPYSDGTLPTPWSRGEWSCFIDSDGYILSAIKYVNRNPTREGFKPQHWTFVHPAGEVMA